jgi:Bacterial regulatory proteins, tetR family
VKQGFADASIRDTADEAGYSLGAFCSNFSTKEDVLLELISAPHAEECFHLGVAVCTSCGAPRRENLARLARSIKVPAKPGPFS